MRYLFEPGISATPMDHGGMVVLMPRTGVLYQCNATAAFMWTALERNNGESNHAAAEVADHYDTDRARVRRDLDELIKTMLQAGLVRAEP